MDRLYIIEKKIEKFIEENHMIEKGDHIVVGVSGGADSICLLDNLLRLRNKYHILLTVVHIHHGIRGKEADEDMAYVESFCRQHNVRFLGYYFDIPEIAKKQHLSGEEAGRIKRYETFDQVVDEIEKNGGKGKIAIAHNANDNCETFLLNLFRGSGLAGLTGIRPVRDNIIRPLLCLTRKEIEEYLSLKNILYREDGTNKETDYTRNKLRLEVLPYVEKNINANVSGNITKTIQTLTEAHEFIEAYVEGIYMKVVTEKKCDGEQVSETSILKELCNEKKIIRNLVIRKAIGRTAGRLKDITSTHIESVESLYSKEVSKASVLPYGLEAVRTYDGICIRRRTNSQENKIKSENNRIIIDIDNILKESGQVEFKGKTLTFDEVSLEKTSIVENKYTKWMSYDILKDTLEIRGRMTGDYMIIDNLGRRKKIKDLFIDMKIPRENRDDVLLLARGSEILWVIGYRMSEKCKVGKDTKKVIRVKYSE